MMERVLSNRMSEVLRTSQDLVHWVAIWIPEVRELERTLIDTSNWAVEQQDRADRLEAMLEDVPGDTLEQKIQRMFHEMEQAHKRLQY